ncbi:hypothetical protein SCHPADRAFT_982621 [Schizopora paradoxa]|uniref:Uncharacterized protein n=1 Tax=Schizopora paradoxa TaxID=27342 RepID=A0A0H2REZ0_9AGAM|nr:hypothetical protein SCHPADRAFT_982621 [Schizopora paradoxa]
MVSTNVKVRKVLCGADLLIIYAVIRQLTVAPSERTVSPGSPVLGRDFQYRISSGHDVILSSKHCKRREVARQSLALQRRSQRSNITAPDPASFPKNGSPYVCFYPLFLLHNFCREYATKGSVTSGNARELITKGPAKSLFPLQHYSEVQIIVDIGCWVALSLLGYVEKEDDRSISRAAFSTLHLSNVYGLNVWSLWLKSHPFEGFMNLRMTLQERCRSCSGLTKTRNGTKVSNVAPFIPRSSRDLYIRRSLRTRSLSSIFKRIYALSARRFTMLVLAPSAPQSPRSSANFGGVRRAMHSLRVQSVVVRLAYSRVGFKITPPAAVTSNSLVGPQAKDSARSAALTAFRRAAGDVASRTCIAIDAKRSASSLRLKPRGQFFLQQTSAYLWEEKNYVENQTASSAIAGISEDLHGSKIRNWFHRRSIKL